MSPDRSAAASAYLWSAFVLAIALGLFAVSAPASILAIFPAYFAAQIAWSQWQLSHPPNGTRARHRR